VIAKNSTLAIIKKTVQYKDHTTTSDTKPNGAKKKKRDEFAGRNQNLKKQTLRIILRNVEKHLRTIINFTMFKNIKKH